MRIAVGVFGAVAVLAAALFLRLPPSSAVAADLPPPGGQTGPTVPTLPAAPTVSSASPNPGEVMRADIESLDAVIQSGLEDLAKATAAFSAERGTWTNLDRSIAAARRVNLALLARNTAVVDLYEGRLSAPLTRFKDRLREAPAVYRTMADERRQLLAQSTLEVERRNYLAMVETCEAAALLCERRREELFGETAAQPEFANRPRANAVTLARTIANMKRLQTVHGKWEETFAAYPTALESPKLSEWFNTLSVYGEDLDTFTRSVEGLKDAMKRKATAAEPAARPTEPERLAEPASVPVSAKPPTAAPSPPTAATEPTPAVQSPVATSPRPAVVTLTPYRTADGRVVYYATR